MWSVDIDSLSVFIQYYIPVNFLGLHVLSFLPEL